VLGLVKDPHDRRVIAYRNGSKKAHCVDGVAENGYYSFETPVQLITTWRNGLMVYDDLDTLQKEEQRELYREVKLGIKDPLWAVSSPEGNRVIFGGTSSFYLVDISRPGFREIKTPNQSWYSALFLDETLAWIAGSSGGLREVEFVKDELVIREIGTRSDGHCALVLADTFRQRMPDSVENFPDRNFGIRFRQMSEARCKSGDQV